MNRGYALSRCNDPSSKREAIAAYTEAIQILDTLPAGSERNNALGAALMNRGQLHHQLHGTAHSEITLDDFQQATAILSSSLSEANPWPRRNLVGTLLNHANLLLDLNQPNEAKGKAEAAIEANSQTETTDPTDAELTVLAIRSFCDSAGQLLPSLPLEEQDKLAATASERVSLALVQIRLLRPLLTEEPFAEASIRLFHFGSLLLATHQPLQLESFVRQHIETLVDMKIRQHLIASARQSIPAAIDQLQKDLLTATISPREQDQLAVTANRLAALHQQLPNL